MNLIPAKSLSLCAALLLLPTACNIGDSGSSSSSANLLQTTQVPPGCVSVASGECLTLDIFIGRRDALAANKVAANEYASQLSFRTINLPQAHAALELTHGAGILPGAGVTVALVDSGLDDSAAVFQGVDINYTGLAGARSGSDARPRHGTSVASVLAGSRVSGPDGGTADRYIGLVPGADVDVYGIWTRDPDNLGETPPADRAQKEVIINEVLRQSSPHFVSLTFGQSEIFVENYLDEAGRNRIRQQYGDMITSMAQSGVDDPTVFLRSAGNDNRRLCTLGGMDVENCEADSQGRGRFNATSPSPDAALMVIAEELRANMVVVVATDAFGVINNGSNRCGVAADWCIAAPGEDIFAFDTDESGLAEFTGTSYSTPMVAGGLAMMRQFFRGQLSNTQLLQRLYATAKKTGIHREREIYGQGLMDLGAAMNPVGTPLLRTSAQASAVASAASVNSGAGTAGVSTVTGVAGVTGSNGYGVGSSRISTGAAFGDGLLLALEGQEVAAFDSLGAPFWFRLADFVGMAEQEGWRRHDRWLRDLQQAFPLSDAVASPGRAWAAPGEHAWSTPPVVNGWHGGWHARQVSTPSSLLNVDGGAATLAYTAGDWEFTTFTTTRATQRQQLPRQGAVLVWRPQREQGTGYGIRLGMLSEPFGLLGSHSRDGFGNLSALSTVLGLEWRTHWRGWRIAVDTEWGFVDGQAQGGLLQGFSGLSTSAASLQGSRQLGHNNHLLFSLSQPPRLEGGQLALRIPVGRTPGGEVLVQDISAALTPSSRQIDLAAHWHRGDLWGGELRLGALHSWNPGHMAGSPETGLLLAWQSRF